MSVETFVPHAHSVSLTDAAVRHFERLVAQQPGKMVRLSTKMSGCTGYAYVLDMVDEAKDDDERIEVSDTLTFLVDEKARELVNMTELDYVQEGINGVVKFNNPNVTNECGCGESFNVE
ncbi:HesB/IscA family protein [Aestuariibacter salexigens]|uniref:HesB/IscA family protein n=1 Tax=Aestuariibacter salexigens TaxID=226010 RepID=UPI0004025E01|nr:iron-sulfur cluster assembly accessory protein [Aestuariibacter salexigens]